MTKYIVAMRNGTKFTVDIPNFATFLQELKAENDPKMIVQFFEADNCIFNLVDVLAIYPLSEHVKEYFERKYSDAANSKYS
jgi:hypothetical protein